MKKKGSNTDQENKANAGASGVVNGGQIVTNHSSNGPGSGGAGSPTAASTTNGNGASQAGAAPNGTSANGVQSSGNANAGQNTANGQINSTSPTGATQ